MREFKKFDVWQNSRELVKKVYLTTNNFPDTEKFGLTNQLRRAAVSIAANIAEGSGRSSDKDFKHFLNMAYGSAHEVECLVILAHDLVFIGDEELEKLESQTKIIEKQLLNFMKKL
ncbi:MAG: four helix bundle protein [Luteibaculaceae bacterium]